MRTISSCAASKRVLWKPNNEHYSQKIEQIAESMNINYTTRGLADTVNIYQGVERGSDLLLLDTI